MPNYGVFTQICVLQEFRDKKQKIKKKQQIWLKNESSSKFGVKMRAAIKLAEAGSVECRDIQWLCHDKE